MKKYPKMKKYKNHDLITLRKQAELASEFYKKRGPGPIFVFPVKRTGQSKEFREFLSKFLCTSMHGKRLENESTCKRMGYPFVEVDPSDY